MARGSRAAIPQRAASRASDMDPGGVHLGILQRLRRMHDRPLHRRLQQLGLGPIRRHPPLPRERQHPDAVSGNSTVAAVVAMTPTQGTDH